MRNINEDGFEILAKEVHDGYIKTIEERGDGSWEAKFINTANNIVLYEVRKPLKSTALSMVGSFIKKFDYDKDKNRGIPKLKKAKNGKNFISTSHINMKPKDPLRLVKRLETIKKDSFVTEIDGVIIHNITSQWASRYCFNHKNVNYSLDIDFSNDNQIEIYISNCNDYNLGINYTKEHIPKLIKWLKSGIYEQLKNNLYTEDDNVIHPETPNKYKNKMYIWMFSNYDVICSKGV